MIKFKILFAVGIKINLFGLAPLTHRSQRFVLAGLVILFLTPQVAIATSVCSASSSGTNEISSASNCSEVYWYAGDLVVQSGVTINPPSNPAVRLMNSVNTLTNFGTLTGSGLSNGVVSNSTISGGIVNQNSGLISTITNFGMIGPYTTIDDGIYNAGIISLIDNSGQILGNSNGLTNTGTGQINTLTNNSLIQGLTRSGISNYGQIDFFSNRFNATLLGGSTMIGGAYVAAFSNWGGTVGYLENQGKIGFNSLITPATSYVGIYNTGTINNLSNSTFLLSSPASIVGSVAAIYNDGGTIESLSNAADATISSNAAIFNANNGSTQGRIGALDNQGVIEGDGSYGSMGISNDGRIDSFSNFSLGIIRGSSAIFNNASASIGAINNSGSIEGFYEYGINNLGTITAIDNSLRITGSTAGIQSQGSIGTITNTGKIGIDMPYMASSNYGIINSGGTINAITNSTLGSSIAGTSSGILNDVLMGWGFTTGVGYIGNINNQGVIAGNTNYGIDNLGRIDSIHNQAGASIQSNSDPSGRSGIFNHRSFLPLASLDLRPSGSIGTILNENTITGYVAGIENEGDIALIDNQSTGRIEGSSGIRNTEATVGSDVQAATITLLKNAGQILGTNLNGVPGDAGIYNKGTITALENLSGGIIASPLYGIYNDTTGTFSRIDNTGSIASNTSGGEAALYNAGTITSFINRDTGYVGTLNPWNFLTASILNTGGGLISNLDNYGKIGDEAYPSRIPIYGIRNDDYGFINPNRIGTLRNFGSIDGETGIQNGINAQIETLTNASGARITGSAAYAIANNGSIGVLTNQGTISGYYSGVYNDALGTIQSLENSNSIIGLTSSAVRNDNSSLNAIAAITNLGVISGDTFGIENTGWIGAITNRNQITGTTGSGVYNSGTISTIVNEGSLSGPVAGIENLGTIGILRNSQGAGGGSGPLSIAGNLPGTYQIGITSPTQFGQLNANAGITGIMQFEIAPGSTVTLNTTYNSVLGGFDASNINNFSTTYDGWLWTLESQTFAGGIWKLTFPTIGPGMTATTSQLGFTVNPYFTGGSLQLGLSETVSSNFVLDGSGMMIAPSSGSATVSGVMSGSGSLTISGPGSLVLSGNNTYTGATTINSVSQLALSGTGSIAQSSIVQVDGVLDISATTNGASIQSLAGSGTTALGNQNLTISNASSTYTGAITGTGGVTVSGGVQQFAGSNTYTGATTISSGSQLALLGSGSIAQSSVVQVDGVLDISATTNGASIQSLAGSGATALGNQNLTISNASSSYAGAITGTGGVTVSGGVQQFSGTNTYGGGTTVQNATLWINADAALGNASANLQLNNGTLKTTESFSASRPVILQGSGNVIEAGLGANVVLDGALSGAGALTKQGEGRLVVNGVSTNTGDVTVAAGTLKVGQSEAHTTARLGGNIAVQAGALLQGHGMIAGSVSSTGTVQPGGSIGTLTIAGNYTQTSSGTLQSDVTPTANSVLNVLGDATIAGGLVINAQSGTYSRKTYTLLSSNRLTGQFGTINTNLASNIRYQINYDTQNVYFEITYVGPSTADTQSALNTTANYLQSSLILQNAVLVNSLGYDCTVFDQRGICISVGGRNTIVQAREINNTSGLLIAAYRVAPQWRLGLFADQNLSASNPSSYVQLGNATPLVGAFAAWSENSLGTGWEVRMAGAYGQKSVNITRPVVGTSEAGSGSSNLTNQGVQATVKYGFPVAARWTVSPYAGMRYTQSMVGAYTEATSATVAYPLSYSAVQSNATTALAGLGVTYQPRVDLTFNLSGGLESDTNTSAGSYVASNPNIPNLTPISMNLNPVKTRPTALVGASYAIEKNHVLGITGIYRQEPYRAVSSTTVLATYTIGF